jgi:hypothetical protein
MMKSAVDVALPADVVIVIRPEAVFDGTGTVTVVSVDAVGVELVLLNFVWLFAGTSAKFVPVIVTEVPATPIVGENPVIVGGSGTVTVNDDALVAEPEGLVTAIVPLVAPVGTVTSMLVVVDAVIVAAVPLNVTAFCAGVALKPVPVIVTGVPTGPEPGVKPVTVTVGPPPVPTPVNRKPNVSSSSVI